GIGQKISRVENRIPLETIVKIAAGQLVLLRKGMIHPSGDLAKILLIRPGEGHVSAGITSGDVFQQTDNRRVRSGRPLRGARDLCRASLQDISLNRVLKGEKKERPIVDDRAAEGTAKLVALELVARGGLPGFGVKDSIADKLEPVAM